MINKSLKYTFKIYFYTFLLFKYIYLLLYTYLIFGHSMLLLYSIFKYLLLKRKIIIRTQDKINNPTPRNSTLTYSTPPDNIATAVKIYPYKP